MKKSAIIILSFSLFLVSCIPQKSPQSAGQSSSAESSYPATAMKLYTNAQYGFHFAYPADWSVENASEAEAGFNVVAWIYSPSQTEALRSCRAKYKASEWLLYCGPQQANSAIGVYNYGFIDYEGLSDWEKGNYPNYQLLHMGNQDVLSFSQRTPGAEPAFHVNSADGKRGMSFLLSHEDKTSLDAVKRILAMFVFEGN